MTFVKGQSGNPAGKKKGTKNKFTEFKQLLTQALYSRQEELRHVDFEQLLHAWVRLMPRDMSLKVEPNIKYISNVPRDEESMLTAPDAAKENIAQKGSSKGGSPQASVVEKSDSSNKEGKDVGYGLSVEEVEEEEALGVVEADSNSSQDQDG
jgi:hypothetical protein|tara:strand:+ start:10060 stop:10515 length:456 start_codon:yes stop_codon:yes gene_type:complete